MRKTAEWEHKGILKIYQGNKDRTKEYKVATETINIEMRRVSICGNGEILRMSTSIHLFLGVLASVYKG